jgi:hypothetical protein
MIKHLIGNQSTPIDFILEIADIPAYIIKAAARPSLSNGEIVLDHINVDRKVKGKTRWNDISITLYDPIVPSGAQAVMEWVRLHHESATGRNGYSSQYKKDLTFKTLSGPGEIIEQWEIYGAYILDANFGTMDWGTDEAVQIELTLKYDWALLDF